MKLKNSKILLVDDEEDILEFVKYILTKEGAIVETAKNGVKALKKAEQFLPELILLDKMMPDMDGIATCIALRKNAKFDDTRILFLSAMEDIDSQIEGLDVGADDYIVKPIKSNLLISKIKSHLRNNEKNLTAESIHFITYKHITIDRHKYMVYMDEDEIRLPRKLFELFFLLMSSPDTVFKREDILEKIWGKDVFVGDRTIDVHIRKLRKEIGEDYFQTVKGVGYKFVAF